MTPNRQAASGEGIVIRRCSEGACPLAQPNSLGAPGQARILAARIRSSRAVQASRDSRGGTGRICSLIEAGRR